MSKNSLFARKPLGEIISYTEHITSVYVVEHHIWAGSGNIEEARKAISKRQGSRTTVEEYLIDPVRPLLNDIFRHISAPYYPEIRDNPVGQGYWIQAEFGSGKSHLLSFIGAMALGESELWDIIKEKEKRAGKGKRESIYQFYEGISKKSSGKSRGIFVVAKTFVGQGGAQSVNIDKGRTLVEYLIEAVKDQYIKENNDTIPLYPTELLAKWFMEHDLKLLSKDLEKFLKDPKEFDEEEQWTLSEFLENLQDTSNSEAMRECGKRLWDYYEKRRGGVPQNIIPEDPEPLLMHMVKILMEKGYEGVLFILDEMSLFMKNRDDIQRAADEKTLTVLSNRLVHYYNLPVWTICAAQQKIESQMGEKNIIANERLKLVPLLNNEEDYHRIVISRIRTIENKELINTYWEDYSRGFTWPGASGKDRFYEFFPCHPDAIDIMKKLSYQLTTIRAGLDILYQTLKTQTKKQSHEMITMWCMFDDMLVYEEDPSGTTSAISSIKTKWNEEWNSYITAKKRVDSATKGHLKVYRDRCLKILKTLFLYHVAKMATDGLSSEQIMNCVMEWKDHNKEQEADSTDNLDHYEMLVDKLELEIAQINKINNKYVFNPVGGGLDPNEVFRKARSKAESQMILQKHAWENLLGLREWKIETGLATLDLSYNIKSIFHTIAPSGQEDLTVNWHNREIEGRVYMRDLYDIASQNKTLPVLDSAGSKLDFFVFISSRPAGKTLENLIKNTDDPRIIFWIPDELSTTEKELLIDFTAYSEMIKEYQGKDTDEAREMITWVQNRLKIGLGSIYKIIPDSYGRGIMGARNHSNINFKCQGQLLNIINPVICLVLDSVYKSREFEFIAHVPFNDTEAIKVINGIVKTGVIDKNAKKDKNYSAAQNFGYDLGIMKKTNDKKLDTEGNVFLEDIKNWIDDKFSDSGIPSISVETIYKNFTGINGPGGINYGLSIRMIQIFLLCMAREGKIKVLLKGKGAPVDCIDSVCMGDIDFKVSTLESFERIVPVKAPEGWPLLAPFAALLLKDDGLSSIKQDGEISSAVKRILDYREKSLPLVRSLSNNLNDFFSYIKRENPVKETVMSWLDFLSSEIGRDERVSFLRHSMEKSFGYKIYSREEVKKEDIDDFKVRLYELERAHNFAVYTGEVKIIYDYGNLSLPDESSLIELKKEITALAEKFDNMKEYMESDTAFHMNLFNPGNKVIEAYINKFLNIYNLVDKETGQAKEKINLLLKSKRRIALEALYSLEQIWGDIKAIENRIKEFKSELFHSPLSSQEVKEILRKSPHLNDCPLNLFNGETFISKAEEVVKKAENLIREELKDKAHNLLSGALRARLKQGEEEEEIIREALKCNDKESLADLMEERLGSRPELVDIFRKYLKKIVVKKLKMSDFKPTRKTIERHEVDDIVEEFRVFIEKGLKAEGKDELPVVELE